MHCTDLPIYFYYLCSKTKNEKALTFQVLFFVWEFDPVLLRLQIVSYQLKT